MAQNLEVHLTTLDPADQTTRPERDAYLKLARESRRIAGELRTRFGAGRTASIGKV